MIKSQIHSRRRRPAKASAPVASVGGTRHAAAMASASHVDPGTASRVRALTPPSHHAALTSRNDAVPQLREQDHATSLTRANQGGAGSTSSAGEAEFRGQGLHDDVINGSEDEEDSNHLDLSREEGQSPYLSDNNQN